MLSVEVKINGETVVRRTAVRVMTGTGVNLYRLDDGTTLYHRYKDGAAILAAKILREHAIEEGVRNAGESHAGAEEAPW